MDFGLAGRQHEGYRAALAGHGWRVQEVPGAEDCPDSVFFEDTVVVCGGTAVITRLAAPSRRPETDAVEATVRELGLAVERIERPGTLDGGDVLQIGHTVYVGLGAHVLPLGDSDVLVAASAARAAEFIARWGYTPVVVDISEYERLEGSVTCLSVLIPSGLQFGRLAYRHCRQHRTRPGGRADESGRG